MSLQYLVHCLNLNNPTELRGACLPGTLATKSPQVVHSKAARRQDDRLANPKRIAISIEKKKQACIPDFLEGLLQTFCSLLHAKAESTTSVVHLRALAPP